MARIAQKRGNLKKTSACKKRQTSDLEKRIKIVWKKAWKCK